MKYRIMLALVAVVGLCTLLAMAQSTLGTVKGVCKDADGNPIVDAIVRLVSVDTGRKYELKTNKRGEYMSIGIAPAQTYTITLIKDGKEIDKVTNYKVSMGDNDLDFDLKKRQDDNLKGQGVTAEQAKEIKKQQEAAVKEQGTVKQLNEKLIAANTASASGDYDTAITVLTEASQIDPGRDLIWYKLADAYSASAVKQADSSEKTKRLDTAVEDYLKAIDFKKKDMASETKTDAAKTAAENKALAAYYNGLGNTYGKQGKPDEAMQSYNEAARLDPPGAGTYYFNLGAQLTNANKTGDQKMTKAAAEAFDKATVADPTKADAYYWKAQSLLNLATLGKDNKMILPEGTVEAYQKYLELKPDGPHAAEVKATLESIGATIETSYGTKKKPTPKK